jgi:peptidoglycan/LPS O-acetylase OafA/YrhL
MKSSFLMKPRTIYSHTGLRGVASIAVLMTHVIYEKKVSFGVNNILLSFFNWPNQAVDLFFILSGFILNWVYFGEDELVWGKYIISRCARILPLYYLTLLAFLPPYFTTFRIMGWMYEDGKVLKVFLLNLFLLSGFLGANHIDWVLNVPSWSISIEFFAYLFLFPALIFVSRFISIKTIYLICAISLSGLTLCYILEKNILLGWDWTRFFRGFFAFPLGFFTCTVFKQTKNLSMKFTDKWLLPLVFVFFLSVIKLFPSLLITLISPFFVYFSASDNGFFCKALKQRFLQWLGERSYSIYLWHCPIIYVLFIPNINAIDAHLSFSGKFLGWINVALILLIVAIISELSFKFFENPIRKIAHRS